MFMPLLTELKRLSANPAINIARLTALKAQPRANSYNSEDSIVRARLAFRSACRIFRDEEFARVSQLRQLRADRDG